MPHPDNLWLRAGSALSFDVAVPTPMVFMLRPRSSPGQWIADETYQLVPSVDLVEFSDSFGNLCQRLVAPVGDFTIRTSADVLLSQQLPEHPLDPSQASFVEIPKVPHDVLQFLLPSRYCEADRFGDMATEIVAGCQPGYAQVTSIVAWVGENIRNTPLSSIYPVSAIEINQRREGVCRDLAHIAIALCRALCIPARLVVGYLHGLEPMDIHAWFQAYVGGEWHTFDPANPGARSSGRIAIAVGRDAADVAIYNQFGPMLLPYDMQVTVAMLDHPPRNHDERPGQAAQ